MWSTWFLQNFLKTNLGAWSILFFFIYRLVHSLMTTLERNSLFMLEMTTRVLEGCWITSIKKLFLIFLVESAWYEFKLVHIETYLWVVGLFFPPPPPHSSKQRSLLVLVKIQKKPLKRRIEFQALEPRWLTVAVVWPQFLTLAFVVCSIGAWSCIFVRA